MQKGIKPPVSPLVFWSTVAILIIVLFLIGMFITQTTIEIDGCKASWSTAKWISSPYCPGSNETYNATCQGRVVTSPLCPGSNATFNDTCLAELYIEQHNAVVEVLRCACTKAGPDYTNESLNSKIVDVYKEMTGATLNVRDICEGGYLTIWRYRG
jgi:hypothetical protein